jgi:hypothetical protein
MTSLRTISNYIVAKLASLPTSVPLADVAFLKFIENVEEREKERAKLKKDFIAFNVFDEPSFKPTSMLFIII